METPGGSWSFGNLDSLARGESNGYVRDLPVGGSQLAFQVNQIAAYLQDRWLPSPRLTLTAGLRLDVPFVPTAPAQHDTALRTLGINSALTPSGNALWSPRLGVNYDLSGRGTSGSRLTIIRKFSASFAMQSIGRGLTGWPRTCRAMSR